MKKEECITQCAYIAGNARERYHGTMFISDKEELLRRFRGKVGWFIYEYSIRVPQSLLSQFEEHGLWPEELEDTDCRPILLQSIDCAQVPAEHYAERIARIQ